MQSSVATILGLGHAPILFVPFTAYLITCGFDSIITLVIDKDTTNWDVVLTGKVGVFFFALSLMTFVKQGSFSYIAGGNMYY